MTPAIVIVAEVVVVVATVGKHYNARRAHLQYILKHMLHIYTNITNTRNGKKN